MKAPDKKPVVKLAGNDSNAFAVMGSVKKALRRAGADEEYISKYFKEAMASDYGNLLVVSMQYVNVE